MTVHFVKHGLSYIHLTKRIKRKRERTKKSLVIDTIKQISEQTLSIKIIDRKRSANNGEHHKKSGDSLNAINLFLLRVHVIHEFYTFETFSNILNIVVQPLYLIIVAHKLIMSNFNITKDLEKLIHNVSF